MKNKPCVETTAYNRSMYYVYIYMYIEQMFLQYLQTFKYIKFPPKMLKKYLIIFQSETAVSEKTAGSVSSKDMQTPPLRSGDLYMKDAIAVLNRMKNPVLDFLSFG